MTPRLTIIESPYSGDIELHTLYARLCVLDSIERNEIPFASHLFYTQMLDDTISTERTKGFELAEYYYHYAVQIAAYTDLGRSSDMSYGIALGASLSIPTIERRLFPASLPRPEITSQIRKKSLTLPTAPPNVNSVNGN